MLYKLSLAIFASLVLTITIKQLTSERDLPSVNRTESAPSDHFYGTGCEGESGEIRLALNNLPSREYAQVERARNMLLGYAKKSSACRNEVIRALMKEMDKPNLDFERDVVAYLVWREGSQLLGELRATEALDLLIAHLDMTNGFHSSSQAFQPALLGVRQMGETAIPKLAVAIRENPQPSVRKAAAYCLTEIGGIAAMEVLKQAQASEYNECVARFIDISLSTFGYKSKSGRILFDNDAPQADAEARRNWLTAFECIG